MERSDEKRWCSLDLEQITETEEAVLLADGDVTEWVPKSMIEMESTIVENVFIVNMPEWLALDKGFI